MREFKLWNQGMTNSFSFTSGVSITDIKGLGLKLKTTLVEGEVGEIDTSHDNIQFRLEFGIDENAYTSFTSLANFLASNGKNAFVLEYSVNGLTRYCDVYFLSLSKSEKNTQRLLEEQLVLERRSLWYTIENAVIPVSPSSIQIENPVFVEIQPVITITGATTGSLHIQASGLADLKLNNTLTLTQVLTIDTYKKTVILDDGGTESNGYNLLDKTKDSFLMIPQGTYSISIVDGTAASVGMTYKKWVFD